MIERAELPVQRNSTLNGRFVMAPHAVFQTRCGFSRACASLLGLQDGSRRRTCAGALAAVFGEIGEQRIHGLEARRIDHRAALAPDGDEARRAQPVKMEGEGVGRETERARHLPGGQPLRSRLHQQPKHVEPVVLGQRGEGHHCIRSFPYFNEYGDNSGRSRIISIEIEMMNDGAQKPGLSALRNRGCSLARPNGRLPDFASAQSGLRTWGLYLFVNRVNSRTTRS